MLEYWIIKPLTHQIKLYLVRKLIKFVNLNGTKFGFRFSKELNLKKTTTWQKSKEIALINEIAHLYLGENSIYTEGLKNTCGEFWLTTAL